MAVPIQSTKLYIPPPRSDLVERTRLLDRLDHGLESGGRLTVVVGPPGSGKTTLIANWVYSAGRATASRSLAWLSLDTADSDPARFMRYLIAAIRQVKPLAGRGLQGLLGTPQMPPLSRMMESLMVDLSAEGAPGLLVLDDYQYITTAEIHQALGAFVAQQPPYLHLVFISRELPPFPLAALRVRGAVTEIDAQDLRFTHSEARALLTTHQASAVPEAEVEGAVARTEGWVAGLQLLQLAAQRSIEHRMGPESVGSTTDGAASEIGRQHAGSGDGEGAAGIGYITDYLVSEVLSQQPADTQSFLKATAMLGSLTGSLCDYVAECEGSAERLARLAESGLFVVPLDNQGQWYRYHRLFAEAIVRLLSGADKARLHRRAAIWHGDHEMPVVAVGHALAVGETTGDWGLAAELICRHGEEVGRRGELMTVKAWLEALPERTLAGDAALTTLKAWILAISGDLAGADLNAKAAVALLGPRMSARRSAGDGDDVVGKLQALRSFIVLLLEEDNIRATVLADEALRRLPPQAGPWRVLALWARAEAQERLDHLTEAIDSLWQAQRLGRAMRETLFAVVAEGGLVKLLNDHGRRREALALCEDALGHYCDARGEPLPLAGYIYSHLGNLHCEANDLLAAQESHTQALALGEALGVDYELIYQRAIAAPTWYALGESDRALAALREGRRHASQAGYADADWFLAWEANIRLWQGDFVFARHWAETSGLSIYDQPRLLRIEQHMAYARFLIAESRHADARHWLGRLEVFTREHALYRWQISVNLLQAVVADRLGDRQSALALLARAVESAAPEGYVRPFLVEGPRLVSLLADVRSMAPDFVDRVRAGAQVGNERHGYQPQTLAEPLTNRELEVLDLIAGGATNREVADRLVIAPGTVKRHTNHIYGKLQVHNRTEAVARARELGLLA